MTMTLEQEFCYKPELSEVEADHHLLHALEIKPDQAENVETGPVKTADLLSHRLAIGAIKFIHTAIFAMISTCVLYVFVTGVRGRSNRWTLPAILIVLAEGAVFFGNHWRCPLTQLTEKLGASKGQISDIFLPRWFAQRIPQIYTPLFIVGLVGWLWHQWPGQKHQENR